MVPDFRRDDVWTPAFAGVTLQETFYESIRIDVLQKVRKAKPDRLWHFPKPNHNI